MAPSRELAMQTHSVVKKISRGYDLISITIVGGDSINEQFMKLASNPDIIIATPGNYLN